MKRYLSVPVILLILCGTGCVPVLIGAGAAGGYKVGTDERSAGQMWDDAAITARVNTEFLRDPFIKSRKIDVDTIQQVVTLTGVLATEEAVRRAAKIAGKVAHVKDVKNYLQVGKKTIGESFDDKMIGSKIKAKLIRAKDVHALNIDVDVNKRVVTLTGVVESQKEKDIAIGIARKTLGVASVNDNMIIRKP